MYFWQEFYNYHVLSIINLFTNGSLDFILKNCKYLRKYDKMLFFQNIIDQNLAHR